MEAKRLILETDAADHKERASLTADVLREITRRVVKAFAPEKIFLFGSYTYGQPNKDSDVDVLIVVKDSDQPRYRRARNAYAALRGIKVPTDVIVMTQDEFNKKSTVKSSLVSQAIDQGKLLYGTGKVSGNSAVAYQK